uniref:Putative tubby C-terminal-like domain-containing protein n=1 Tax=Helianthus annuus TaxID=4232 RepID=A0A251S4E7_HELAN
MINNLFSISYNFTVTDVAGKVVFKCEYLTFGRRVLLNAARKPILLFQKKLLSFQHRWTVFKGNSLNSKDIIFITKGSPMIYPESLDVIMGNDENKIFCHFKVKGDLFGESCTIYARDGNIIAQVALVLDLLNLT